MHTTTRQTRRDRWRFFLEHAGYAVPPGRAACALELAKAEELLDQVEGLELAAFTFEDDDLPYDPGDVATEEEARDKLERGEWTGPYYARLDVKPDTHTAGLGGIVFGRDDTRDPYARVVRAELALEAADELRRARGAHTGDDRFRLELELGNAEMQTRGDVADLLELTAARVRAGADAGKLLDRNGSTVGTFRLDGWFGPDEEGPE